MPRNVPVILQDEAADCGLACLAMLSQYHRQELSLHQLKARYGSSVQGCSLYELHEIATDLGFVVRGLQFEPGQIAELALPALLHWSGHHFVVLEAVEGSALTIVDPAFGRTRVPMEHASRYITGYALEVVSGPPAAAPAARQAGRDKGPSIFGLILSNRPLWPLLAFVAVGAMLFQLLSLTVPYLVSLVIDKAVTPQDHTTLILIVYVFAGFFLAKMAILFINARLQAHLHRALNAALYGSLARHLLSLPYIFFLRRSAADVHARLRTLDAAHAFFMSGVFEVPLSVLYSAAALALLFFLEATAALVALGFILLTTLLEWPAQLYLESHQKRRTQADIDEAKTLVSSLLRIDQVKLNGAEHRELQDILQRQKERVEASRDLEVAQRDVTSIVEAVRLVEKLALVYVLATKCIAGQLSIGLAVAFLLFADEIKERLLTLIRVWSTYRATRVQLMRLQEICAEQPEFEPASAPVRRSSQDSHPPAIALEAVSFTYQKYADAVLKEVALTIRPRDKVVLFGPSGSGKSTLLRIISTLLAPSDGRVLLDGKPCEGTAKARLRLMMGGLFAEDKLMDGTILTNITRDVPVWKDEDVQRVIEVTGLREAIAGLESGLNTLIVGDGRGVSSGQAQRILLARVLLRAPPVLLLDEPTSHCDRQTAANIAKFLAGYDGTVVVCTHDPVFLQAFGTAFDVTAGCVKPLQAEKGPHAAAVVRSVESGPPPLACGQLEAAG